MESEDINSSHSWWWDRHIGPENSKWLAENLKEVDQTVKEIHKLIKEDGDSFATEDEEIYNKKRPELIARVDEFSRTHQALAERYEDLTRELQKNIPPSSLLTPDGKIGVPKLGQQAVGRDLVLSSGGGSSDFSLKENSEYSSSQSSDSDSESSCSSIKKHTKSCFNGDPNDLHHVNVELEMELPPVEKQAKKEVNADGIIEVRECGGYETLLQRITEYEEALKISNAKLQSSEEEISRLTGELKKNEPLSLLVKDLQSQLESAHTYYKSSETDLEMERRLVLELQEQVAEMENLCLDSSSRVTTLMEELEVSKEKFRISEEEVTKLKHELAGELEQAQKEIESLQFILCDAHASFSLEKVKFEADISGLIEQRDILEARIKELETRSKSQELEIRRSETEEMEFRRFHDAHERSLLSEVNQLKAEISEKNNSVEALNKTFDGLKLQYDMLMAEKDGLNAKVQSLQTLMADVLSRDNRIQQLEEHSDRILAENAELISISTGARKQADKLRSTMVELEKEVNRQRVVISDKDEEKREAIRQLCFSIEHYRSGYEELRQAFIGCKRHAVFAS